MTQIMIEVQPETLQHIHAMMQHHPETTFGRLAGSLLDAQVAYRLEIERMANGVREANPQHMGKTWL